MIYVGKAKSLRARVASYFREQSQLLPKTGRMVEEATNLNYQVTETEIDALLLEANYIRKLAPKYNVNWKDGKSYPLIEITTRESIPMVRVVHQETNPKARYFGPYPSGSDLTSLLRFLRRIFPYVSQKHQGNRPCLRSYLGLCPCQNLTHYRRDLQNLIYFLNGQRQLVQRRLNRQMEAAAKAEKFEEAGEIKNKLVKLELLTTRRSQPWEYETNPNLASDRRKEEMRNLADALKIPEVNKIEGYDISNTAGKQATGAQVVFVDGVPEKNFYRRYKIKISGKPDDYLMLEEMLKRRVKSDIPLPELIVIDGGKGQLGKIKNILPLKGVRIVALAKKLETLYTDTGEIINFPDDSPALHLLQRLRDEAHRFSRRYHFYLRHQKMLS